MLGDTVVAHLIGGGNVLLLSSSIYDLITVMNYAAAAAMAAFVLALDPRSPTAADRRDPFHRRSERDLREPEAMTGAGYPSQRIATWLTVAVGSFAVFLIYAPSVWLGVMSVSERPLSGIPWPLGSVWYDELFRDTRKWLPPLELSLLIGIMVAACCMVSARRWLAARCPG